MKLHIQSIQTFIQLSVRICSLRLSGFTFLTLSRYHVTDVSPAGLQSSFQLYFLCGFKKNSAEFALVVMSKASLKVF